MYRVYYIFLVTVTVLFSVNILQIGALDHESTGPLVEERSVKKELNQTVPNPAGAMKTMDSDVWSRKINAPEMSQMFYIFLGISFLLIGFILYRMHRLRKHRAERRYGVQGDKSCQELDHLPTALIEEDESELEEEEELFDINKTRVYVA